MGEWKKTTLGDFISLRRGHDLPERNRRPGTVPVVGSGGIVGWHDTSVVPGPGITIGRAANLGVPTLIEQDFWPLNTTLYVTDFHGNDIRFTFYLLRTLDLTGFNSGSVQPMLNRNYIRNFPLLVPDPSEQRAIAAVLGALDDKIAVNERITDSCDKLAESLLDQLLAEDTEVKEIPLGEIAKINPRTVKPVAGGYLRYIDISCVSAGRIEWPKRLPWDKAPGRARRGVSPGDTIWSTVRPGRRSYALILDKDPEIVVSTGFVVLTPVKVGPAFLYEIVKRDAFVRYLENVAEGSAYPAVRPERFASATIPLPSVHTLQRFEDAVMPLRCRAHAADQESRTLAQLRDTLLPKLMSGELRVRDAEKAVEEAL